MAAMFVTAFMTDCLRSRLQGPGDVHVQRVSLHPPPRHNLLAQLGVGRFWSSMALLLQHCRRPLHGRF